MSRFPELKKLQRRQLRTSNDIRRYLANLLLRLEADHISPEKATKCGYLASLIQRCISDSELEERMEQLEDAVGRKR